MSFKRVCDGSENDLFKSLESQRIKELLGIQIPEGEAKLLSNGRLTCMICSKRPIFDTINVLSIHRKGKKHLLELSKYLKRKEELELIQIKKDQKEYIQSFAALKKTHMSSTDRKKKLELTKNDASQSLESVIVSRYITSIKKKPSLHGIINHAKKHPYQQSISNSFKSTAQDKPDFSYSLNHKIIDDVHKIGWIKHSDGSWSKDPQAEFDSDDY